MKYIITESQYNKAIDRFITMKLEPLQEITSEKYPDSKFWVKNGVVIAEIRKSGYFLFDYKIWDKISNMFSLEYHDTQSAMKHWLEEHYKLEGLTPNKMKRFRTECWKDIIN